MLATSGRVQECGFIKMCEARGLDARARQGQQHFLRNAFRRVFNSTSDAEKTNKATKLHHLFPVQVEEPVVLLTLTLIDI
jgi:hypothetical protein